MHYDFFSPMSYRRELTAERYLLETTEYGRNWAARVAVAVAGALGAPCPRCQGPELSRHRAVPAAARRAD